MRINDLFRFLSSLALSFAIAVGNVFCLVTAFNIPVRSGPLAALCLMFAFVFSALFITDKTHPVPAVTVALGVLAFVVVYRHELKIGFEAAKNTMLALYSSSYGWVFDVDELYAEADATHLMSVIGGVAALLTAWTVSRRDGLFALSSVSGGLLAPCLMIIQSPPAPGALLTLVCAYAVLLLTQTGRRYSSGGQYASVFGMALPVVMAVAIVYLFAQTHPAAGSDWLENLRNAFKEQAERHALFRQDTETGRFEFVSPAGGQTLGEYKWNENLSEVDLSTLGGQRSSRQRVMQVYSDSEGRIYLRGNSFAIYENNTWSRMNESAYGITTVTANVWNSGNYTISNNGTDLNVKIRTDSASQIMYLPFVPGGIPEGGEMYYDEYVVTPDRLTEYTAPFAWYAYSTGTSQEYEQFVYDYYRQIPVQTRDAIHEIIKDESTLYQYATATARDSVREYYGETLAYFVGEYVKSAARYDLATPTVPEGEDFVSWFLTDSETGYCVHYATAAVMILRYFNVPARYVNGYVVETKAGRWTDVTQNEAHAWVEFYSQSNGWCLLEVTPEVGDAQIRAEQQDAEEEEPDDTPPEEEQEPVQPEAPENEPSQPESEPAAAESGKRIIIPKWVWYTAGLLLFWLLWNIVIRRLRRRYLNAGGRNKRTIRQYRRIAYLSKVIGEKPPEEAESIAMKTRFSQYTVTQDELERVIETAERLTYRVQTLNNPIKRFVYRYIICV